MHAIERNLARYLEIERLLNDFFSAFNFCRDRCILPKGLQSAGRPVAVCCGDRYYALFDLERAAFERLRRQGERLYGKPGEHAWMNPVSPCEYHEPENGCILKLTLQAGRLCGKIFCRKTIAFQNLSSF